MHQIFQSVQLRISKSNTKHLEKKGISFQCKLKKQLGYFTGISHFLGLLTIVMMILSELYFLIVIYQKMVSIIKTSWKIIRF